ncbi:MAG TPA: hypothetical protein VJX67_25110, partial [Blastocatellia bacterium]|nr:hypothetical protein [Blastocatellia bacterium]
IEIRTRAAVQAAQEEEDAFPHKTNGDEELYANQAFAGNFSKTLPHDPNTALVIPSAYQSLLSALKTGTLAAFDQIPRGGPGQLAGPLSPLMFQIEGEDSPGALSSVVPPSVASAGGAAEMVEIYWEAYLRDVPFINYPSNPLVAQAVTDMNRLSAFAGPRPVTAQNLFRYPFIGCTDGPYVSQFLYQTHALDGALFVPMINSRFQVTDPVTGAVLPASTSPGVDYMTNLTEYVSVQNGNGAFNAPNDPPNASIDPTPRFVRNVRDLGSLAASDSIFSIYFRAAIIMGALGIPSDPNIPYNVDTAKRINGFNTFSSAWLFSLIGRVHQTEAHAFYQKWYVHRKVRPEAHANLVDGILTNRFSLHPSMHQELLTSSVLPLIFERNRQLNLKRGFTNPVGSFFAPQELNGGSPSHPSSPAGHAFTAGACVTMIKAFFDLGTPQTGLRPWPTTARSPFIPFQPPSIADADGLALVPTGETDLTVLGELNKLATNIAEGRNMSGIHWRVSDDMLGLTLGENVAIYLLNETAAGYPEKFEGFTLTKFDGTTILVGGNT